MLMADQCCSAKAKELEALASRYDQRRVLIAVLVINALMLPIEFGGGLAAGSSALIAGPVVNLGAAFVHALSQFAHDRGPPLEAAGAFPEGAIISHSGVTVKA